MKKRLLTLFLVVCLGLCGCQNPQGASQPAATPVSTPTATPAPSCSPATAETADILYLDFTAGSEVEDVRPMELPQGIRAEQLCDTLTDMTGIPFGFTVSWNSDRCTVSWQKDSALWCDEMPQDTNPDYVFYDENLLRWFLLDTVWRTLTESYGAQQVRYCTDNQRPLVLDSLWPLEHFDLSQQYQGSAWYYSESIRYKEQWDSDAQMEPESDAHE